MSAFRFPSVFFSHGTPMLAYGEDGYQTMLQNFSASLPKPKAIIFVSAHSVSSDQIHVLKTEKNWIQHDFTGFPKDLYDIQYNCPGDPLLANQVAELFVQAGFETTFDLDAPLDHGIWIPLLHLYPKGDIPVVRISLPLNLEPARILKMGHTLAALREEGIMIVASGGAVHNLRKMKWAQKIGTGTSWAQGFEEFLVAVLGNKDVEALLGAAEHPEFNQAHPSNEHFLPLLFAVGAALAKDEANILYRGIEYDSLSMLCFSLNHDQNQSLH
jgi:4,5-DOPA dioxygenase extradiol